MPTVVYNAKSRMGSGKLSSKFGAALAAFENDQNQVPQAFQSLAKKGFSPRIKQSKKVAPLGEMENLNLSSSKPRLSRPQSLLSKGRSRSEGYIPRERKTRVRASSNKSSKVKEDLTGFVFKTKPSLSDDISTTSGSIGTAPTVSTSGENSSPFFTMAPTAPISQRKKNRRRTVLVPTIPGEVNLDDVSPRSSLESTDTAHTRSSSVSFADFSVMNYVEDALSKCDYDDLFYNEDDLAEFRQSAFLEKCGLSPDFNDAFQ